VGIVRLALHGKGATGAHGEVESREPMLGRLRFEKDMFQSQDGVYAALDFEMSRTLHTSAGCTYETEHRFLTIGG
jgi:hypothetical protein